MKKDGATFIAWGISLLPLVFCLLEYNHLVDDPSTKMSRANGVIMSKNGYLILIGICCLLFFYCSDVLASTLKQFFPEKYHRAIRFSILVIFTTLNILGIVSNLKG